jgi:hydroxylamine reductase
MFCYQCEQAGKGTGCTEFGVCGKDPDISALQDLLVQVAEGISQYAHRARVLGVVDRDADVFVVEALFTTVTNVNFDSRRLETILRKGAAVKDAITKKYAAACKAKGVVVEVLTESAQWQPAADLAGLIAQGKSASTEKRTSSLGADVAGTQDLILLGLKGVAAYAEHARILGREDDVVYAYIHEALNFLTRKDPALGDLLGYALKTGEVNLRVMELLDAANTGTYGNPVPTSVNVQPVKGKAILVSGHDLKDLELLLKQTEGKGINIYTHGEMLPAHGYPELKKFKHLVGNYGGA